MDYSYYYERVDECTYIDARGAYVHEDDLEDYYRDYPEYDPSNEEDEEEE